MSESAATRLRYGIVRDYGMSFHYAKRNCSQHFRFYLDMYSDETLPTFSWWERCKCDMQGESNVDLAALKEATAKLLEAWTMIRAN